MNDPKEQPEAPETPETDEPRDPETGTEVDDNDEEAPE